MADERLTLRQAAARLGVSESAIRKRVERDTLRSDKGPDGRRYVYLEASPGADTVADVSATGERDALISAKDETIAALREQLEQANERDRENRRIIAALTSRIPAIEAPSDEREAPETVEERADRERPRSGSDASGAQEGARRPWWRRVFGG